MAQFYTAGSIGAARPVGMPVTSYSSLGRAGTVTTLGAAASPVTYASSPTVRVGAPAVATAAPVVTSMGTARVVSGGVAPVSTFTSAPVLAGGVAPVSTFTSAPVVAAGVGFPQVIDTVVPTVAGPVLVEKVVQPEDLVQPELIVEPASLVEPMPEMMTLTYWPLLAKGLGPAIALQLSGTPWQLGAAPGSKGTGDIWAEWLEMKPEQTWGFLPNVNMGDTLNLGSELAILQYLARKVPTLAGANDVDFRISQELLHQSEELYQKMSQNVPTIMDQSKSPENFEKFWTSADRDTHSSKQGLPVYLTQFEELYAKLGGSGGCYTSGGMTIGEIKLYSTLVLLIMIDNGILSNYPGLYEFYMRWESTENVKQLIDLAMSEWGWQQYFIAPPAP